MKIIVMWVCFGIATNLTGSSKKSPADIVLDNFHLAASKADFNGYFSHFTEDGVFLGTDKTERWPVEKFKAFTKPYFSKGTGWTYVSVKRNINYIPGTKIAFFDEILTNKSYGNCRGSGVLRETKNGWKISQYNLSIPIPNGIAKKVVSLIQEEEKKETKK